MVKALRLTSTAEGEKLAATTVSCCIVDVVHSIRLYEYLRGLAVSRTLCHWCLSSIIYTALSIFSPILSMISFSLFSRRCSCTDSTSLHNELLMSIVFSHIMHLHSNLSFVSFMLCNGSRFSFISCCISS